MPTVSNPSGYSATPLAVKLGIKAHSEIAVVGAPDGYRASLEPLPPAVRFTLEPSSSSSMVQIFVTRRVDLATALAAYRSLLAPQAVIWVSWPKKSSRLPSEVTEDTVRDVALPLGFVDVKVCAVSDIWSGLKLVVRKALR